MIIIWAIADGPLVINISLSSISQYAISGNYARKNRNKDIIKECRMFGQRCNIAYD